jgi:hypothetical protein
MFTNRPIVPASREKLLPEYQYKPYTTEVAKSIGKVVGYSPAKIENLIRGWSGGLGMHVLKLANLGFKQSGGRIDPARTLADIPVIQAFVVRHPTSSTESIRKFYDDYFAAREISDTYKFLMKREFDIEEAHRVLKGHELDIIKMEETYKALKAANKTIEYIYATRNMDSDQKRQLIDNIYRQMSSIARQGNQVLKRVKANIKQKPKE